MGDSAIAQAQADEVEALQSIYVEEFELLETSPQKFRIKLLPATDPGKTVWVGGSLECTFTPTYPDAEPPLFSLTGTKGIDEKQKLELLSIIKATAEENAGAACVYTVAERVREWLSENNFKPSDGSAFDEMMRRKEAEATLASGGGGTKGGALSKEADPSVLHKPSQSANEADEETRKKRYGTPFSPEAFIAWRIRFEAEMEAKAKSDEEKGLEVAIGFGKKVTGKLSGRQLFEQDSSLVLSDALNEEDAAGVVDAAAMKKGSSSSSAAAGAGPAAAGAGGKSFAFDMSAFKEADLPSDDDDEEWEPDDDDDDEYDEDDDDEDDEEDD